MFEKQRSTVFLDIKLTNQGRRLLSLGKLRFTKALCTDREINYKVGRSDYELTDNMVLFDGLAAPTYSAMTNFDGTPPYPLNPVFLHRVTTAYTRSDMFNTAATFSDTRIMNAVPSVQVNPATMLRIGIIASTNIDGAAEFTPVTESPTPQAGPAAGNLILAQYFPPTSPQPTSFLIGPPFVQLWYRGISAGAASNTYSVDRKVANFNTVGTRPTFLFVYPMSGISTVYGTGATVATTVWNLNIVRTSPEFGYMTGATSAHTSFASIEYSGMKHFFGFDDNYRQVGFIHYTNAFTGKTNGDRLLEGTVKLHMPTVMWWRKLDVGPGQGNLGGHVFTDHGSGIFTDNVASTTYTILKDGEDAHAIEVGRVYQKLGIIVITDPELLTVMSYKSNRCWTLPPLDLTFSSQPVASASTSNTTGMCQSGKTYLVTYTADYNDSYSTSDGAVVSYGYQPSMHCGYIQRIDCTPDSSGRDKYLRVSFPPRCFPFMRSGAGAITYSGTGWIANSFNILVKEVATSAFTGIDNIEATGWTRTVNNGYYGGTTSAIDPYYAQAKQFVLTRADYTNGSQYNLGEYFGNSYITDAELPTSGLTYGMESFFYGNIYCGFATDDHVVRIDLELKNDELNSSKNDTFDGKIDTSTYVTEVALFNDQNVLVATAKPSYPIRKNYDRNVMMRMELIY